MMGDITTNLVMLKWRTNRGDPQSLSVDLFGCWRRGFGLWSRDYSYIPESGSSKKVPGRILVQIFRVRIVVTYFWSSPFVRFFPSWGRLSGLTLWFCPVGSLFFFQLFAGLIMSSDFPPTVLLDVSGFPTSNRNVVATAITNRFASLKVMAVQFVGNVSQFPLLTLLLSSWFYVTNALLLAIFRFRDERPRPQNVFVYNFPFETKNVLLAGALNKFGEVKDGFNRSWWHLSGVPDGVRVVSMVRNQAIPRNLDVEGFRVKVSYYGQVVECDICERLGDAARNCPLKWKCLLCHQPGHLARECGNPRADSSHIPDDHPADTPSVGTPSEVAQPTSPADSNNLSNDSRLEFHLLCCLIRPMLVLLWRRTFRLLVFPLATMISRIHLALILSVISIKVVLTKNEVFY